MVSYLAMGIPAVIAGYLATRQGDILATARELGAAVIVLSALTLIGALRRRRATAIVDRKPTLIRFLTPVK